MYAGNLKDATLRSRKLQVLNERQFVTDIGGQSTSDTLEVFDNQQILRSAKQRVQQVNIQDFRSIAAAAGSSQTAEVSNAQPVNAAADQTGASSPGSKTTQSAVLLECCASADVSAKLTQLQHLNKFALATYAHHSNVRADGSLELKYFCCRGPNAYKPYITQYVPLGDIMQRRSIETLKKCGCGCYVRLHYPQGSFPNSCPVSGKPFAPDTTVGKA